MSSQYGGVLPEGPDTGGLLSPNDDVDAEFISEVNTLIKEYIAAMEAVKLRLGLQTVMLLSSRGNLYLQSSGLGKALMTENPARCAQVVTRAINLIYVLSVLIHPFMPETGDAILAQLNAPARAVPEAFAIDLLPGHEVGTPEHLFKRIDEKLGDVWRDKFGGQAPSGEPNADATHVAPAMSKRKAAAAKKAAATASAPQDAGPKSAEVLAWEQKIAEQGELVRQLKAKTPKTKEVEDEIAAAVDDLKKLKGELADLASKAT